MVSLSANGSILWEKVGTVHVDRAVPCTYDIHSAGGKGGGGNIVEILRLMAWSLFLFEARDNRQDILVA